MNLPTAAALSVLLLAAPSLRGDTKLPAPAQAAPKAEKTEDQIKADEIRKLLAAANLVEDNVQAARKAIQAQRKTNPKMDPKFWDDLEKLASRKAFEEILVKVYGETYTLQEIQGILRFYRSPAGKAFLQKNNQALYASGQAFQGFMEAGSKALQARHAAPGKN